MRRVFLVRDRKMRDRLKEGEIVFGPFMKLASPRLWVQALPVLISLFSTWNIVHCASRLLGT